jgi:hypothetical protein
MTPVLRGHVKAQGQTHFLLPVLEVPNYPHKSGFVAPTRDQTTKNVRTVQVRSRCDFKAEFKTDCYYSPKVRLVPGDFAGPTSGWITGGRPSPELLPSHKGGAGTRSTVSR